jgi:hypothetical protein
VKPGRFARHDKVLIVLAFLAAPATAPEQTHVPYREHSAVAQRAPHEPNQSWNAVAFKFRWGIMLFKVSEFGEKLFRDPFVGVEM